MIKAFAYGRLFESLAQTSRHFFCYFVFYVIVKALPYIRILMSLGISFILSRTEICKESWMKSLSAEKAD